MPDRRRQRGRRREESESSGLAETVVNINRCATTVKGGRRMSFSALVVVGDREGRVGYGFGKAREVSPAVEKGGKEARAAMVRVPLVGGTIPHAVTGRFGSARVFMRPARPGTGVIAGPSVRAVLEAGGVKDILTKSYGSSNPCNLVKATMQGLTSLRGRAEVAALRGVELEPTSVVAPEASMTPEKDGEQ